MSCSERVISGFVVSRPAAVFCFLISAQLGYAVQSCGRASESSLPKPQTHERNERITRLKSDVHHLAQVIGERSAGAGSKRAAEFISTQIQSAGLERVDQVYSIAPGHQERNIEVGFGKEHPQQVIVGAHYDTAPGTPGADDNASGVAVLLELVRRFGSDPPPIKNSGLRLVFFSTEEPPYFRSEDMGSAHYAKLLQADGKKVRLMICVESVGMFSDEISQEYPLMLMRLKYPGRGNFLALIGTGRFREQTESFGKMLRGPLPLEVLVAPPALTGVDFSDHLSFWQRGMPAVMLTDTAFYRNKNYHEPSDLPGTLNYNAMALLTESLDRAVRSLLAQKGMD